MKKKLQMKYLSWNELKSFFQNIIHLYLVQK